MFFLFYFSLVLLFKFCDSIIKKKITKHGVYFAAPTQLVAVQRSKGSHNETFLYLFIYNQYLLDTDLFLTL